MPAIVTLTMNPSIDKFVRVDELVPEKKLRVENPELCPGGGGINVALAVQALGGDVQAYLTRGGYTGDLLVELLREDKLDFEVLPIHGAVREDLHVFDREEDCEYRFTMPGPEVSEAEWTHCLEALEEPLPKADYLVASGSLPPGVPKDFYARLAKLAARHNVRYVLDTKGEPLRLAAEAGVYLLKPNRAEIKHLLDEENPPFMRTMDERKAALREAHQRYGTELLALTLGSEGGILCSGDHLEHVPSPDVEIRSSVGAGDCTVAGLVQALAEGRSELEAFRFGLACGASAVSTPGHELCRRRQVEELLEAFPHP